MHQGFLHLLAMVLRNLINTNQRFAVILAVAKMTEIRPLSDQLPTKRLHDGGKVLRSYPCTESDMYQQQSPEMAHNGAQTGASALGLA